MSYITGLFKSIVFVHELCYWDVRFYSCVMLLGCVFIPVVILDCKCFIPGYVTGLCALSMSYVTGLYDLSVSFVTSLFALAMNYVTGICI